MTEHALTSSVAASAPVHLVVGVDLVQISDVARSLDTLGERYVRRLFTDGEIAYCTASPEMSSARFAARFAAKEATLKALRLHDPGLDWRAIEVRQTPAGWCELQLHGDAAAHADRAGWISASLSLSHEGDYATAMVGVLTRSIDDQRNVE
jgi:holo-[acyl-carrier protein] synthase